MFADCSAAVARDDDRIDAAIVAALDAFAVATPAMFEMHDRTAQAVQDVRSKTIALLNVVNELPSRVARGGTAEQVREDIETELRYLRRSVMALDDVAVT